MKAVYTAFSGCWYYLWGHIFALFFYDKKYLTGRWFNGRKKSILSGICTIGWKWLVCDAISRVLFRVNTDAKYPVAQGVRIAHPERIMFDPDDINNFQTFGCYFQADGGIIIGKGTYIAPNVGIITSNHDLYEPDNHMQAKQVTLGEKCWIGMNCVILPGVILGDHTIVGAGSVVTKSFTDGYCVIAGNPARIIRKLTPRNDTVEQLEIKCDQGK